MRLPALLPLERLDDIVPPARLLSNGRYSTLLTAAGTGYSAWGDVQLTNWQGDRVVDAGGWFLYLRDLESRHVWSATAQPCGAAEAGIVRYTPGTLTLTRTVHEIEASLAVCVAPHTDLELRRLTLRNTSTRPRQLDVTSVLEIVLTQAAAYAAHPAFAKLFVETEFVAAEEALLARRRPRAHGEPASCLVHACSASGALQWDTDRASVVGRYGSLRRPAALYGDAPLAGRVGSVIDPVFCLRRSVSLAAGASAALDFVLGAGGGREVALATLAAVPAGPTRRTRGRLFEHAAAAERQRLEACRLDETTGEALQGLAGRMLYGDPRLRAAPNFLGTEPGAVSQLWAYGFGDAPLLVAALDGTDRTLSDQLLAACRYWSAHGLRIDLLLVCPDAAAGDALNRQAAGQPGLGRVVIRTRAEISAADWAVLVACAHFAIGVPNPLHDVGTVQLAEAAPASAAADTVPAGPIGDFSPDGSEYVMRVSDGHRPPLAWINVIANEHFGFLCSERGAGYTWSRNSRQHRLTPWLNDFISDPHEEALYVRDEEAGTCWSPQPGPIADPSAPYEVRHGFGYTRWQHDGQEIEHDVVQFVPRRGPLKFTLLRLVNRATRPRRLAIVAYQRLVLGATARDSARLVVTERDDASGALIALNRINAEFSDGEVFAAAVVPPGATLSVTTDRAAFLGRQGDPEQPTALRQGGALRPATGSGLDPCFAQRIALELPAGGSVTCAFLLGEGRDRADVRALVARYADPAAIDAALAEVQAFWRETLGAVQVQTPSPAIDPMLNGWLLYQVLSCRLWARSALYQSGGAYGFRDQLQDAAALVYTRPDYTRAQLLRHAAHQFVEGDVLHWWHPPLGRGIRTRFSDDLLWLPYLTAFYLKTTGDWSLLDERAAFLTTRPLEPDEDEAYLLPELANEGADLYEHCCRALDRGTTRGAHGLPLMGTGDWNDGMNRVGREGRGESVWVGFFLYDMLADFVPICRRRGDEARAQRYEAYRSALGEALNDAGWDGAWYRRAYYDDGTPLGSAQNSECRIDLLAQAWSVISGAAPPERAAQAMDAVEAQLVVPDPGLIRLLTPPFDRDTHDPGYIKGYVPGIRENGGQYTHAAVWAVRAFAELGRRERAATYLEMLSPVSHTRTPERRAVYQVEPYVMAADVYGVEPHVGRGGWTWYTGSAGWMYRVALESVLGVRMEGGDTLVIHPCVPDEWPAYRVRLRRPKGTIYEIAVENPSGSAARVVAVSVDGVAGEVADGHARVTMVDDGAAHTIAVRLGA